jgi:hypothetical protein
MTWFWLFVICYIVAGLQKMYSEHYVFNMIYVQTNHWVMAGAMAFCFFFWWLWDFAKWIVKG